MINVYFTLRIKYFDHQNPKKHTQPELRGIARKRDEQSKLQEKP